MSLFKDSNKVKKSNQMYKIHFPAPPPPKKYVDLNHGLSRILYLSTGKQPLWRSPDELLFH